MVVRRRGWLWAALLGTALSMVVSCASGTNGASSTTDARGGGSGAESTTAEVTTETFEPPTTEATTDDPSPSPGTDPDPGPAISVARLPVGGQSDRSTTDPALRCARVSWIASEAGEIPAGSAVEITSYVFEPDSFEALAGGCGAGVPDCWRYLFRPGQLRCDLLVRALAPVDEDAGPQVGMSGLLYCPDNDSPACQRFLAAVAKEEQISVDLSVPQLEETSGTGETQTETITEAPPETGETAATAEGG